MASLVIPASFRANDAADWFERWARVRDEPDLLIDFTNSEFFEPCGIVLLAAGIADRVRRNLRTSARSDRRDAGSWPYLQRIDFFSELGVDISEHFQRHDTENRFVPMRRIVNFDVAQEQADLTAKCMAAQLSQLSPSPIRMARFVFEELGANIVQHSGCAITGFGAAQVFPKLRRLQIAFADAGVGFLRSLSKNPEFTGRIPDDADALQLAISPNVSSVPDRTKNMGFGLKLLLDFADRLGGDLRLASGTAMLHRRSVVGNQRANAVRSVAAWQGSFVCLDAPLP